MKVSIVVPAYNEEDRIGKMLDSYCNFFESLRKEKKIDYEILVVINGTTDNTEEVVRKFKKQNKRISYLVLKIGAKGLAVMQGFKLATSGDSNLIGFVDADLATGPESFYDLIRNIGNADGIVANRYLPGSKLIPKMTFRRIVVAKVFNLIVRTLLLMPYTDTQCGAKLFNRKAAEFSYKNVKMSQLAFDVELLFILNKAGFRIKEISTVWTDMDGSKLNIKKASIQMLLAVLQLRILYSPFRKVLKPIEPLVNLIWRAVK